MQVRFPSWQRYLLRLGSFGSGGRVVRIFGRLLAFFEDQGKGGSESDRFAFLHINLVDDTFIERRHRHRRFVGFHFGDFLVHRDGVTFLFEPFYESAFTHRVAQFWHCQICGHEIKLGSKVLVC
jgi:hypothetical protein